MLSEHTKTQGWELCDDSDRQNVNDFEYSLYMAFIPYSDDVMRLPRSARVFDKGYVQLVKIRRLK